MAWFNAGIDDVDIAKKNNDGKLYKIVQLAAIIIFVLAAAVFIFNIFGVISLDSTMMGVVISVGMLGLGGLNELPWVRIFERIKDKRFKITAIVFMALVGLVVILWIVCVWQIIGLVNSAAAGSEEGVLDQILNSIRTIRIALIVSLQFMVASGVAMNVVKYRKTMLPYQIMNGVALLYVDFYISLILTSFTITNDFNFEISPTAEWLSSPFLGAVFFIAIIVMVIVGTVFARADKRRLIATANEAVDANEVKSVTETDTADSKSETTEEKLSKIQSLYDKGLISREEFESKRKDILDNI